MKRMPESTWIAWAGWMIRVPPEWRPVRIFGDWARGRMMVGDTANALMQIKWWRPGKGGCLSRRFVSAQWLREHLKGARTEEMRSIPEGFDTNAWVPAPQIDGEWVGRSLWYGHHSAARVVIEISINATAAGARTHRLIEEAIIPSLRATPDKEPTRWSVFGASFEAPPGFVVHGQRLHLGDLTLLFESQKGERLLVRQIYPSDIALKRRSERHWLSMSLFKEYRKFIPASEPVSWGIESNNKRMEGLIRKGVRKLPFPLGFAAPRTSIAAIVHNRELGRLLFAEYDTPGLVAGDQVVRDALLKMNWAIEETA